MVNSWALKAAATPRASQSGSRVLRLSNNGAAAIRSPAVASALREKPKSTAIPGSTIKISDTAAAKA